MSEGLDPEEVDERPPLVETQQASPVGPPPELTAESIAHLENLLRTNPEVAIRMAIARRSHLPMSRVVKEWSMLDLAWELAADRQDVDNVRHRCPSCGIDSRDQLTDSSPRAGLGDNPAWRLEVRQCPWCEEKDELQAKLQGQPYKRPPPHVYYVPALPGEPFFDEGQVPKRIIEEEAPETPQEPPGEPPASNLVE